MITVAELFAGVGGFRLGLEKNKNFSVIWSNQYEPSTKKQWASDIYVDKFGSDGHSNIDINLVSIEDIPNVDLLVGGFPCQDYSVANKTSLGIEGKKGVLWWCIHKILYQKKIKPKYILLENVDRLINSPTKQRGRDFAIILKTLNDLGYAVEWRIINPAEYGMPQKRKRVFIMCYLNGTKPYNELMKDQYRFVTLSGVLINAFPISNGAEKLKSDFKLNDNLLELQKSFNDKFYNAGSMINGSVTTLKVYPNYNEQFTVLGDIVIKEKVGDEFYIKDLEKWKYLKGSKRGKRITKEGYEYDYVEGPMQLPDPLNKPARTIITAEGGTAPSRFKHVVDTGNGLRRLTPIELERANMFPDNHTQYKNITDSKRAFIMGNALVVGVVTKIANQLINKI